MRDYKRKTNRGSFTKELMEAAVADVKVGLSLRDAAKRYDFNFKPSQDM